MGKRIWTIEEERIVCSVFLNTKKCGKWAADLVNEELKMNGIEPRKISSITAKLGDYKKIDERGDLSHVAPKSIRVYASLYKSKSINFEGLDRFISNLNSDSKFEETITLELDTLKRSNFIAIPGLPKPTPDNKDYRLNFSNYFRELIKPYEAKGRKYSEIYGPVSMSRKTFDKLKNGEAIDSRKNLLQVAFGLKLSYEETVEFLSLAYHSFNPKALFDQIIIFMLKNKIYNTIEIDLTFYHYGLKETLFS